MRRWPIGLCVSAVVHLAALAWVIVPDAPPRPEEVVVEVVMTEGDGAGGGSVTAPPLGLAAAAGKPAAARAARPLKARARKEARAPRAQAAPRSGAILPAPDGADANNDTGDADENGGRGGTAGQAATGASALGADPAGRSSTSGAGAVDADERRRRVERWRLEALAPLLRKHTKYPPEAERLGLEAAFVVRIQVDRGGHLVSAELVGQRPHALLSDAAFAALRASGRLPPPPAELGPVVQVDVPFLYRLST